jgi:hypothetical protein
VHNQRRDRLPGGHALARRLLFEKFTGMIEADEKKGEAHGLGSCPPLFDHEISSFNL